MNSGKQLHLRVSICFQGISFKFQVCFQSIAKGFLWNVGGVSKPQHTINVKMNFHENVFSSPIHNRERNVSIISAVTDPMLTKFWRLVPWTICNKCLLPMWHLAWQHIWPGNICTYQQFFSCYWRDFRDHYFLVKIVVVSAPAPQGQKG